MPQGEPTVTRRQTVVVVVDDDPVCRLLCARILRRAGYRVKSCATAVEARYAIAVMPVGVVVSDLHLPDPEPFVDLLADRNRAAQEGAAETRETAAANRPALVVMSADRSALRRSAKSAPHASGRLCKPFPPEALIAAVSRAAGEPGSPRAGTANTRHLPADDHPPRRRSDTALRALFLRHLPAEMRRLDRCIQAQDWKAALALLHRLRGGAAVCGETGFERHCGRLSRALENEAPRPGWARLYLALRRWNECSCEESGTQLRRRE